MDAQITQLHKFRFAQYMGNHRKNLLWPHTHTHTHKHTNTNYTLCQINDVDTWLHILFLCNNKFLKGLKNHKTNATTHQLTNLLKPNVYTKHLILINTGNQHGNHQDNTILLWILSYTCNTTWCECLAKLRLDIIYIQGDAYEQNGPLIPTPDLTIQTIEFTCTYDRFLEPSHTNKRRQIQPVSRRNKSTRLEY